LLFIFNQKLGIPQEIRGWGFVGKKSLGFFRVDKQIDRTKIPNPCHKKKLLPKFRILIFKKKLVDFFLKKN